MLIKEKRQKIRWGFVTILLLYMIFPYPAQAKLLPRYSKPAKSSGGSSSAGIVVRPSLRPDRQALNIVFSSLSKAKAVDYTLIYRSEGVDKGVSGSLDLSVGDSTTRELVFGTASSGVYRYNTNISNMKLEVVTELQTGKKTLKRFLIRV